MSKELTMSDVSQAWTDRLNEAIALTKEIQTHPEAKAKFAALQADLAGENPDLLALLTVLWDECVSAQRGSAFWKEMSDAEKALADGAMAATIQSKQNYMRLVQEM